MAPDCSGRMPRSRSDEPSAADGADRRSAARGGQTPRASRPSTGSRGPPRRGWRSSASGHLPRRAPPISSPSTRARSSSTPTRRSSPRSSGFARPSCSRPSRLRLAGSGSGSFGSGFAARPDRGVARRYHPQACQPFHGPGPPSRTARPPLRRPPPVRGRPDRETSRMAVRLSLKLGVVNERDRSPDSPDTIVVVEPTIGSVARSKGSLYLLVTSTVPGAARPRGDPTRRRDHPGRVLLRRVGRHPGLSREGHRARQQAARASP